MENSMYCTTISTDECLASNRPDITLMHKSRRELDPDRRLDKNIVRTEQTKIQG